MVNINSADAAVEISAIDPPMNETSYLCQLAFVSSSNYSTFKVVKKNGWTLVPVAAVTNPKCRRLAICFPNSLPVSCLTSASPRLCLCNLRQSSFLMVMVSFHFSVRLMHPFPVPSTRSLNNDQVVLFTGSGFPILLPGLSCCLGTRTLLVSSRTRLWRPESSSLAIAMESTKQTVYSNTRDSMNMLLTWCRTRNVNASTTRSNNSRTFTFYNHHPWLCMTWNKTSQDSYDASGATNTSFGESVISRIFLWPMSLVKDESRVGMGPRNWTGRLLFQKEGNCVKSASKNKMELFVRV